MLQYSNTDASYKRPGASTALPGSIDCVYFLMWPGWQDELRSNRWHYATRWSQVAPVVLVQPDLPPSHTGKGISKPEPRIPNCRILHIEAQDSDAPLMMLNQVAQIRADMQAHGYRRPLFWLYNPKLVGLYCALPAIARVVHSTENYFEFSRVPEGWLDQVKLSLQFSDLALAVSSGVARGIVAHVPEAKVSVVSNGCDYRAYAAGKPDRELMALRQGYRKFAIYAGNINLRIDFDLLLSCAEGFPDTLFVLAGPVTSSAGSDVLEAADQAVWERILQLSNCRHLGTVDPDRLPDLYAAADIGIIPYKALRMIRESGFALKALEMLASGLPVVSTLMRPLVDLTEGLVVVDNASDFRERVGTLCRGALSQQAQAHMAALCRANDYDNKFRQVLGSLVEIVEPDAAPASHHDPFMAELSRHLARVEEVQAVYGKDRENLVAEIRRLQTVYEELTQRYYQEVTRLQAIYSGELEQRNTEVQRLHTVYGDEVQQRNTEIQRLHTVYCEAIYQRNAEIERLVAELQYFRRFRTAARRIPGAGTLLRALRFLRRPAY
jgi:glycosyltransferase involved in cell wall biosynthesis